MAQSDRYKFSERMKRVRVVMAAFKGVEKHDSLGACAVLFMRYAGACKH